MSQGYTFHNRRGAVLLMVLWMVLILGLLGLAYTGAVRTQVHVTRYSRGRVEAMWAARAGVEKARARLAVLDSLTLGADDKLFDDPKEFKEQAVGDHASFSLLAPPLEAGGEERHGVIDESARLNLNTADEAALKRIENVNESLAQCLLDWRDEDQQARTLGAEDEYYGDLEQAYSAKNAPLSSLREIALVRGWGPIARMVWPEPFDKFNSAGAEETGEESRALTQDEAQAESLDPEDARELVGRMTVWSAVKAQAPDGRKRLNLSGASAEEMRGRVPKMTDEESKAIVEHRNKGGFKTALDLLSVMTAPQAQPGQPAQQPKRAFELQRAGEVIDYFTVGDEELDQSGLINLNTAPREVLMTLPEVDENLADTIKTMRAGELFKNAGTIATLKGMTEEKFKQLYPRVTVQGGRYRVVSRGVEAQTESSVTIEAVLAVDQRKTRIVYWKEVYQP